MKPFIHRATLQVLTYLLFEEEIVSANKVILPAYWNVLCYDIVKNGLSEYVCYRHGFPSTGVTKARFEYDSSRPPIYDEGATSKDYKSYEIVLKDKKKVQAFLDAYLDSFKEGNILPPFNIWSYAKNFQELCLYLKEKETESGNKFFTESKLDKEEFLKLETMLYLEKGGLLSISHIKCGATTYGADGTGPETDVYLKFLITLNKTVSEIQDIEKYWIYYGDIRVNEADGNAFYQSKKYPFSSTKGAAFKLLCYLVKNHGRHVPLSEIATLLELSAKTPKAVKQKVTDYIGEIKRHLGISKDKNKTLEIMVVKDSVILVSNPPQKNSHL